MWSFHCGHLQTPASGYITVVVDAVPCFAPGLLARLQCYSCVNRTQSQGRLCCTKSAIYVRQPLRLSGHKQQGSWCIGPTGMCT